MNGKSLAHKAEGHRAAPVWGALTPCGLYVTYFDADAVQAGLLAPHVGQQDVLRLEIPVDDALAVEDAHGGGDVL